MTINVFLGSNDAFTVSNSNVKVTGASGTGTEAVTIGAGLTGTQLDANVERVNFSGNLSSYTFKSTAGTGVEVRDASSNLILTIPSINTVTKLAFSDGSADMVQTGSSTFTLGGQTVSGTATTAITSSSMGTNWSTTTTSSGTTTGQNFALTSGVDNIVGTSGDNFIDGSLAILPGQTRDSWNNADQIDGGEGTDTLFAQLNNNVSAAKFSNIEVLNVEAQAAVVVDLNIGDNKLTTIKGTNNGGNDLTVNNVQAAVSTYELTNNSAAANALIVTVANAALAGSTDAATLKLSNVSTATVSLGTVTAASGYETITVESNGSVKNGAAADLILDDGFGNSLSTVNFKGAQALDIDFTPTTIKTVNAADMTGALDVQFASGNAQNVTVTGGSGNDIIDVQGYTNADVINGGAGTADRLVLTSAEAAVTVAQSNVSNIEVIGISGAAAAGAIYTLSHFGATGLRLDGTATAGALNVNYATGTGSLDLQDSTGGGVLTATVAGTATTDVLNVTMGSDAAGNAFGQNITFDGAETVNVTTQGGAVGAAAFTLNNTAATQALNISGNQSFTLTGLATADVINASGLTGSATLSMAITAGTGTAAAADITGSGNNDILAGSVVGDIIKGGAGADVIWNTVTGANATAGDVLAGGAGFDTFTLVGSAAAGANYSGASNITDFQVGTTATTTDFIRFTSANTDYSAGLSVQGTAAGAAGAVGVQTLAQGATAAQATGMEFLKLTTGVAFVTGATALQDTFNAAIGSGTLTGVTAGVYAASFYDTTNSKMVIVEVNSAGGTGTIIETGDIVRLVGTIDMTAADYALIDADNFAAFV